jgi:hypothetical protein
MAAKRNVGHGDSPSGILFMFGPTADQVVIDAGQRHGLRIVSPETFNQTLNGGVEIEDQACGHRHRRSFSAARYEATRTPRVTGVPIYKLDAG